MVELLRVLINILDPNEKLHTDSTRLVAMRVLVNTFEVGGERIGAFPSLAALVSDHGCKYLFQLARSDNPSVLQLALRSISTIFEVMRAQLKLQQELFFTFTIDRLAAQAQNALATPRPGAMSPQPPQGIAQGPRGERAAGTESPVPSKPHVLPARGETKELLLDILSQLCNYPSFMVDLFTNYDCDINCENLFSRLIEFATTVRVVHDCGKHANGMYLVDIRYTGRTGHGNPLAERTVLLSRDTPDVGRLHGSSSRRSQSRTPDVAVC
jgi:brefeldin A-resistance guanine nucleotide exchange factor 1